MFDTPVKYELPYTDRPSGANTKPFGTAGPKSNFATGVASFFPSASTSSTRTS